MQILLFFLCILSVASHTLLIRKSSIVGKKRELTYPSHNAFNLHFSSVLPKLSPPVAKLFNSFNVGALTYIRSVRPHSDWQRCVIKKWSKKLHHPEQLAFTWHATLPSWLSHSFLAILYHDNQLHNSYLHG